MKDYGFGKCVMFDWLQALQQASVVKQEGEHLTAEVERLQVELASKDNQVQALVQELQDNRGQHTVSTCDTTNNWQHQLYLEPIKILHSKWIC